MSRRQFDRQTATERVAIKSLAGAAVICQHGGCDQAAAYMFTSREGKGSCTVRCVAHARAFAAANHVVIPEVDEDR